MGILRNTVSMDSGTEEQVVAIRNEVSHKLGGSGDPLLILIRLETIAENQLRYTRRCVTDDAEYINHFVNRHI